MEFEMENTIEEMDIRDYIHNFVKSCEEYGVDAKDRIKDIFYDEFNEE